MDRGELRDLYFDWMYRLVFGEDPSYTKLLQHLNSIGFFFTSTVPRDSNRADDGIELRYRFAYETGIDYPAASSCLDDHPCTVLEMMIALSLRCEEQFMANPDIGNRTGEWFRKMLGNLGLSEMTDLYFDRQLVERVILRFLRRMYDPDGKGGLFYIPGCEKDLTRAEIWYQMCWYLDSIS